MIQIMPKNLSILVEDGEPYITAIHRQRRAIMCYKDGSYVSICTKKLLVSCVVCKVCIYKRVGGH